MDTVIAADRSSPQHAPHGIAVQAFAQRSLSLEQWQKHFGQNVLPLLRQVLNTEAIDCESSGPIRSLAADSTGSDIRIAETTLSTRHPQTLATCQALCKSARFVAMEDESGIEHILQPVELIALHRSAPGLAVFDIDSTLIQQEVIDELAREVGFYPEVAAITEAAMRGEPPYTDFEASLRARVSLLKGVPITIWDQLKASVITFTPGAPELVRALKSLGWKTAAVSGGFTPLAEWIKETLGLDYAYANHLVTDEEHGILTGELVPGQPIIHAQKKCELLETIAKQEGIPLDQVIAVGDGSNDLLMMAAAGLGIAFNAKPKVQKAAPVRLNSKSLLDVMNILGYTQQEVDLLLQKTSE